MSTLTVDSALYFMAIGRSPNGEQQLASPEYAYLDRQTGEIIFYYDRDQDMKHIGGRPVQQNVELRKRVQNDPRRFLEIPCLNAHTEAEIEAAVAYFTKRGIQIVIQ